ncbi:MAG: hypothetical protein JO332_15525 [Planctomycetaceae bacterium]|nr:hypothetical protein [Planctomycetaceae bacterium]
MDGHPDLLALDAVRAGEGSPEERAHVEQCAECRATVDGFRALAARLTPARIDVPPLVRRNLLARSRPPRPARSLAMAAALLIAVGGLWLALRHGPAVPGDVDRSGRVDIVDAYALAVRLRSGLKMDLTFDVNGDGKVDERDVEEIARRSVAIR